MRLNWGTAHTKEKWIYIHSVKYTESKVVAWEILLEIQPHHRDLLSLRSRTLYPWVAEHQLHQLPGK